MPACRSRLAHTRILAFWMASQLTCVSLQTQLGAIPGESVAARLRFRGVRGVDLAAQALRISIFSSVRREVRPASVFPCRSV